MCMQLERPGCILRHVVIPSEHAGHENATLFFFFFFFFFVEGGWVVRE